LRKINLRKIFGYSPAIAEKMPTFAPEKRTAEKSDGMTAMIVWHSFCCGEYDDNFLTQNINEDD